MYKEFQDAITGDAGEFFFPVLLLYHIVMKIGSFRELS
jgi:hypothetical protein